MYKNFRFTNTISSNLFLRNQLYFRNKLSIQLRIKMTNNSNTIDIAGTSVPVISLQPNIDVGSVLEFHPFKDWVSAISKETYSIEKKEIEIRKVEIQNVDYFGPKLGFVKFKVDAKLIENGKNVPGIVFMVVNQLF